MRVVLAPDKFRGTATAVELVDALKEVATRADWDFIGVPMADGGEGTLDALGGPNRTSTVTGPIGDPIAAEWRLDGQLAVIEMARASGLEVAGGSDENDPIGATTYGTGELISGALEAGARRVVVGVGGSATTDGGLGALRALYPLQRLRGLDIVVACDVTTRFVDAAEVFGPQKGASPKQVALLTRRLERLVQVYREEHGVDVGEMVSAGAAGGLAGGLAAVGAQLQSGFETIAEEVELYEAMEGADLVVTGEGFLDAQSFDGKVVGGVVAYAAELDVPVLAIAGQVFDGVEQRVEAVSLVDRFGKERAMNETLGCVSEVLGQYLAAMATR